MFRYLTPRWFACARVGSRATLTMIVTISIAAGVVWAAAGEKAPPAGTVARMAASTDTANARAQANPSATSATHPPSGDEIRDLNTASSDPARAKEAAARIRTLLAGNLDPGYVGLMRQFLFRALIVSNAPVSQILGLADTVKTIVGDDARNQVMLDAQVATALLDRGEKLDVALDYATKAVDRCPTSQDFDGTRAFCQVLLGRVQLKRGNANGALLNFSQALASSPDSQSVLLYLGQGYEKAGKPDLAIDAYARSLGVFAAGDTAAAAPLRAVYRKRFGSLKGLDEKIDAARKASRRQVALDGRRHERPAPEWTLPDLAGKTIQFSDFKGKVVVVDFWGSWCGPCRMELPYFQAMYEKFKGREDVAFVGINWERARTPEEHLETAKRFVEANHYTFPVLIDDHDHSAVEAYQIEGFPTVFLIDKTGRIRYKNVGFTREIDQILSAQIESLME